MITIGLAEDYSMQIDEILKMWDQDCQINELDLQTSARMIPVLHAKYLKIYQAEKSLLLKYKAMYRRLRLQKYEFLINPTQEGLNNGWEIPPQGKLLKNEANMYLDGDEDLLKLELKANEQEEKVEAIKDIIKSIRERNFIIRNIIEDRKWMEGGS